MIRLIGMITNNPMLLAWIALGAFAAGVITGGSTAWTVQGWRLDKEKVEHKAFVEKVAAIGEQAKKDKDRIEAENKLNKEKTDANHKRTTAALRTDIARLRNNASGSGLSAPAASSGSPETTCLDRAKFDAALRRLDQGVLGIVESGSQAVIDLDSAKEWANGTSARATR